MPSIQFYRDVTNIAHLSGARHLGSFITTTNARPSAGTLQKRMPTLKNHNFTQLPFSE
jgi:hypothetical protein